MLILRFTDVILIITVRFEPVLLDGAINVPPPSIDRCLNTVVLSFSFALGQQPTITIT